MDPKKTLTKRKRRANQSTPASGGNAAKTSEDNYELERLEKIRKLKQAIDDGTYRIGTDDVARKVIEHILEPKD